MDKEKAKEAFEKWFGDSDTVYSNEFTNEFSAYLAGAEWGWGERGGLNNRSAELIEQGAELIEKLQAELKERDTAIKCYQEVVKKFEAELNELRNGMKGACPTCEPVGEMNKKLRECLEDIAQPNSKRIGPRMGAALKCLKEIEQQSCDGAEHLEE